MPNSQLISSARWQNRFNNKKDIASPEAARRYYSTKQFFTTGLERVFSPPTIIYDTKFFDNFPYSPPNNVWYRYNIAPLRESIKRIVGEGFPMKTRPYGSKEVDKSVGEGPRLLVVSVDVEEATAVTFDSYGKKKRNTNNTYEWKTEYGQKNEKHIIKYEDGVTLDSVIASAAIPLTYDYQEIGGRKFWDCGLLSNTPLRELIGRHKSFWEDEIDPNDLSCPCTIVWYNHVSFVS